jgi:Zn-dependent protease
MNCDKCQKEVFLPFRCQFCGGYFCSDHRLPENHECPRIDLARLPREEQPQISTPRQGGYEYTVSYGPIQSAKARIRFSWKEVSHLAVATVLVIGVGLSIFGFQTRFIGSYLTLTLAVAVFTCSFLIHEMAHKVAAQRRGLWAEFRLTVMGAILTLISAVSPLFKVISPGAVMISGHADAEGIGRISIAGPLTNIVLSAAFLALALSASHYPSVAFALAVGAAFNAWIALFNLIPLGILDGFKIFAWNKLVWASAFTASLVLTAASTYFYGTI